MRKTALLWFSMAVVIAIVVAGCGDNSEQNGSKPSSQKQDVASNGDNQKPKTVVVNKGMNKKQEERLKQRVKELKNKANGQASGQPTQGSDSSEGAARAAAQDYYAAAATGNYTYTYDALSSYSQRQFTKDEWIADNVALGSDQATYGIDSVNMANASTAEVRLTITSPDGTSSGRTTRFVLENGSWKHDLTPEEYALFSGATASASATAAGSSTPPASGGASSNSKSSFGDGTYQVGTDIQPGTYRTREGSPNCYYERLKNFSGGMNSILANNTTSAPAVVTIEPTDTGFDSQGCGTWTNDLSAITTSRTSFGAGAYIVGTDMEPGTYKSSGGNGCYWERLRNFTGDMNSIIANGNTNNPTIVTIAPTDAGFQSQNCGTWTKLE